MQQIDAFLSAYRPKCICLPCLAVVTYRMDDDVDETVSKLVAERRAVTKHAECFNCNDKTRVVCWLA